LSVTARLGLGIGSARKAPRIVQVILPESVGVVKWPWPAGESRRPPLLPSRGRGRWLSGTRDA